MKRNAVGSAAEGNTVQSTLQPASMVACMVACIVHMATVSCDSCEPGAHRVPLCGLQLAAREWEEVYVFGAVEPFHRIRKHRPSAVPTFLKLCAEDALKLTMWVFAWCIQYNTLGLEL